MRFDILTWEEAQKVSKEVVKELSRDVEIIIKLAIAAGRASPCCLCNFRATRNRFVNEVWPERLEKILLKQSRAKRKGKVWSRHK